MEHFEKHWDLYKLAVTLSDKTNNDNTLHFKVNKTVNNKRWGMIVLQTRQTDKDELENICATAEKNRKSTVYKKINEKKINQRVPRKRAINKKLIGDF